MNDEKDIDVVLKIIADMHAMDIQDMYQQVLVPGPGTSTRGTISTIPWDRIILSRPKKSS